MIYNHKNKRQSSTEDADKHVSIYKSFIDQPKNNN